MAVANCKYSYLVRYKCRISRSRKNCRTLLLFQAVYYRNEALVRQLLSEGGVRINALVIGNIHKNIHNTNFGHRQIYSLLMLNAVRGDGNITKRLIRAGCWLNNTTNSAILFYYALQYHRFDVARELIRAGANVAGITPDVDSALISAIHCTTRIIHNLVLLEKNYGYRLDFVLYNDPPTRYLSYQTQISYTTLTLYREGKDVDVCLSVIKMLLNAGAEVNFKCKNGYPPLHWAVYTGDLELVKILIDAGADVNNQGYFDGTTALHLAVLCCNKAMVHLLLSRGAKVSIETRRHFTAFAWASLLNTGNSHGAIMKILLDFGSDANDKNNAWQRTYRILKRRYAVSMTYSFTSLFFINVIIAYVLSEVEDWMRENVIVEPNLAAMPNQEMHQGIVEVCQAQLSTMRNTKIGNTLISYWSVLTEPLEVVTCFARNEEFISGFEASNYKKDYYFYASSLKEKFDAATSRQKLIVQVSNILSETLQFADPSHEAFEIIFKYLTEVDIGILIGMEEPLRCVDKYFQCNIPHKGSLLP